MTRLSTIAGKACATTMQPPPHLPEVRRLGDGLPVTIARLEEKYGTADIGLEPGPIDLTGLPDPHDVALASRRAYWARIVPSRFAFAALDTLEPDVAPLLEEWSAHPGGANLVLFGPVGTGKTHAALAAARARAYAGDEVKFFPIIELLDHLRPDGPKGAFSTLAEADLLVIDDLGEERATDWTAERLGALINRRWMEEKPTIATTNLSRADLETYLGERAFSRLAGAGVVAIVLSGRDRRRRP